MCYQSKCGKCSKTTWQGCGRHVASVYKQIPEGQHCMCKDWPGVSTEGGSGGGASTGSEVQSSVCSILWNSRFVLICALFEFGVLAWFQSKSSLAKQICLFDSNFSFHFPPFLLYRVDPCFNGEFRMLCWVIEAVIVLLRMNFI
jgi:hypothetical protein